MKDDERLARARAGDQQAWAQLVDQYMPMVFAIALRYAKNRDDAQDLTQDALIRCYTGLPQLRDPAKIASWIYSIATNTARRWYGKKPTWISFDAPGPRALLDAQTLQAEVARERLEARDVVRKAMRALPEKLRAAVHLRYMEGLPYREIAAQLDVPLGTIKRRLHQAHKQLNQEVMRMADTAMVLKHAVGLETTGRQHTPIFVRGLHLPARWTQIFSTGADDQREIAVHVIQGDSAEAEACRTIEMFRIRGFAAGRKRGEPQLRLTFEIDPDGKMRCRARDGDGQDLEVAGEPERVMVEEESGFTGYGGMGDAI